MVSHERSSAPFVRIEHDQRIVSKSREHHFYMQSNGDLALYKEPGGHNRWRTETDGKGNAPYTTILEEDGNLRVVEAGGDTLWESGTGGQGEGPYKLKVQDDGNVVIYDKDKNPTWATNTNE